MIRPSGESHHLIPYAYIPEFAEETELVHERP